MKIVKNYDVIMRKGNITIGEETEFMKSESETGFTNDILLAEKFVGKKTALTAKHEYEFNKGPESDLQIVPLKITYEW